MKLQERIKDDMKQSMRDRQTETTSLLRVVIGEFNRVGKELTDEQSLKVIRKMYNNAIELGSLTEISILERYLPKMYTNEMIETVAAAFISLNEYSSMKDMGKVMRDLKEFPDAHLIDGKVSSGIVRKLLS